MKNNINQALKDAGITGPITQSLQLHEKDIPFNQRGQYVSVTTSGSSGTTTFGRDHATRPKAGKQE